MAGDGEIILFPPDRAERRSLARLYDSPNLNEHFPRRALLFTDDMAARLKSEMADNPTNRKAPEMAQVLDEYWGPILRNLGDELSDAAGVRFAGRVESARRIVRGDDQRDQARQLRRSL